MSYADKMLRRSLVKPFYRENAGAFVLVFTIMLFIVGHLNGAGLFEYHYSLAIGMLTNSSFLILVGIFWLLYAVKCVVFVDNRFLRPELAYLRTCCLLGKARRYWALLKIELLLLLPIWLYGLFVMGIGCFRHLYFSSLLIGGYLAGLCLVAATWHFRRLDSLSRAWSFGLPGLRWRPTAPAGYHRLLLSYMLHRQKWMWTAIKLFTCAVFYFVARNNTADSYDPLFVFVFFNFGILANALLLHRVKEFEETYLSWYIGLPVRLWKRWLGYAGFCLALLIPEIVTAYRLTPVNLRYGDAFRMIFSSHSLLLLLYSMLVIRQFTRAAFLRLVLLIGCIQYVFLATGNLAWLFLLFYSLSFLFFYRGYYRYGIIVKN